MSVYTELNHSDISSILAAYNLGELSGFAGITAGIENSNYFIDTDCGRFVMTIFERMDTSELPRFLHLLQYLSGQGFPCPAVQTMRTNALLFEFQGKKGCIVSCLPGSTFDRLSDNQLSAAGLVLAQLHLAGRDFPEKMPNSTCFSWISQTGRTLLNPVQNHYGRQTAELLRDELEWQALMTPEGLPAGIIHADYFCDNILFSGNNVTGVIDFYYACNGFFAYDLAIAINALALRLEQRDAERIALIQKGYEQCRPITAAEKKALPVLLRLSALRFWVSRLYDALYPREGAIVQTKDPEEYREKLLYCRTLE